MAEMRIAVSVQWSLASIGIFFFSMTVVSQDGVLREFAGDGVSGYSGDGGPAQTARFREIIACAYRPSDKSIFIADANSATIRRIDSNGVVSTVMGRDKTPGRPLEGQLASEALLNSPQALAIDSLGNVYISDSGNNLVVMIEVEENNVYIIAGTGDPGYTHPGEEPIPARNVRLHHPAGLAFDLDGNLLIADMQNGVVRRVYLQSGLLEDAVGSYAKRGTSSGDGGPALSAGLNFPASLAVDPDGNIYIAELNAHCIRKVNTDGIITTIAGTAGEAGDSGDGGPAIDARLYFDAEWPNMIQWHPKGGLIVSCAGAHRLRYINRRGVIEPYAGSGIAGYDLEDVDRFAYQAKLRFPYGLSILPSGDTLILDSHNYRIRRVVTNFEVSEGTDVRMNVGDEMIVQFAEVQLAGEITVDIRENMDTPAPGDFTVNGKYYDIQFDGMFRGDVLVAVRYDDSNLSPNKERKLKILHYDGSSWVDVTVSLDIDRNIIVAKVATLSPFVLTVPKTETPLKNFRRGDANTDGEVDVSDVVFILLYLFRPGIEPSCLDAADVNDSGEINITDAIHLINSLFLGKGSVPPPGLPAPGLDQTQDNLGCAEYPQDI